MSSRDSASSPSRRPPGGVSTISLGYAETASPSHVARPASVAGAASDSAFTGRGFRSFKSNVVFGDDITSAPARPAGTSSKENVARENRQSGTRLVDSPHKRESLIGIFEAQAQSPSPSPKLSTATMLPGLGGDPTYIRPGRRPGPSPVPGTPNAHRTRRQTAPHTHNASHFSLAHDDGAANGSTTTHSPSNSSTGTQAAGTVSPKSSFNIISPPSGTGGSDLKSPTKRLSAMKNRSSINFGDSEAPPSPVKPQRRVNSSLGNQSSFVIGDGGLFPVADQHQKASRYTGKMNNSTIVFGDDGGPVNTASRIPVPTKKMSAVVPGGKAAASLAEFAGFHDKSAVAVRETKKDPSTLGLAAGVVSGKHRVF
ncbi:hypothetical protein HDU81_007600 [Chytriomyces hyalinus]|nr:hypothetical protein HDU81_007600 [Chytriomyces hyalinus]